MASRLKTDAPTRGVTEVGPGDFVKIGSRWERITTNSAQGAPHAPRSWAIRTEGGGSYGMYDIGRYAKAEDLK